MYYTVFIEKSNKLSGNEIRGNHFYSPTSCNSTLNKCIYKTIHNSKCKNLI